MKSGVLTTVESGPDRRRIPLGRGKMSVGRASQCDISLDDASVSRHHADIEKRDGVYVLSDRQSRNGTFVNGVAVVFRQLADNDRIAFGKVELVFNEVEAKEDAVEPRLRRRPGHCDSLPPPFRPAEATSTVPEMEFSLLANLGVCQSWQVVRQFAETGADIESLVRFWVETLAGMQGVRKTCFYGSPLLFPGMGKWLNTGDGGAWRCALPEAKIREVAVAGGPHSLVSGRCCPGIPEGRVDGVCLAVAVRGKPCGALYVEGDGELPRAVVEAAKGVVCGLGVGLDIWHEAKKSGGAVGICWKNPVIVGRSKPLQDIFKMAEKAAATDATVLLRGETGTGKELFARLIYAQSQRQDKPFIPVQCSAIEETLMGSALFGHEKGAFTGAVGQKKGVFEEADGGTIFLDEVGELSLAMQVKLLRVLQEGEFMRVGGTVPIRVNVRVIAATNRDLEAAIGKGAFRQDLYYRFNVIAVTMPPLRERRDDIPEMVRHFLAEIGGQISKSVMDLTPEAMACLERYAWPGNVRELRNVVERAVVLAEGPVLTVDDLPAELLAEPSPEKAPQGGGSETMLAGMELRHIRKILDECAGNKRLAAQRLGISRSTLYEKLK